MAIINHSYRQQFSHLPLPKFIPHTLGWFLLFCYRSPKNRLKQLCIPLFSFSSPRHRYTVPRSLSPFLCSLLPVHRSLFPVPCSSVPLPSVCFACSLLPVTVSRSLFSVLCFLFSVPCSPLPVANSLLPVPCSFFPSPFFIPYSSFPILILSFLFPNFEVNKAIQTDRQTSPSSPGCRTKCQSLVVLSNSHARHSHPFARENRPCFIFICRLLFMSVYFWDKSTHFLFIFFISYMHKC